MTDHRTASFNSLNITVKQRLLSPHCGLGNRDSKELWPLEAGTFHGILLPYPPTLFQTASAWPKHWLGGSGLSPQGHFQAGSLVGIRLQSPSALPAQLLLALFTFLSTLLCHSAVFLLVADTSTFREGNTQPLSLSPCPSLWLFHTQKLLSQGLSPHQQSHLSLPRNLILSRPEFVEETCFCISVSNTWNSRKPKKACPMQNMDAEGGSALSKVLSSL